jgi:hypothetical protein
MRVTIAQHPRPPQGEDRVFVTDRAVLVLDGASAFTARDVPAGLYAEHLGSTLADLIEANPEDDLSSSLAAAIETTAAALGLTPGDGSPSSTVAICRLRSDDSVDLLVLGDSQIAIPDRILRDDRLAPIGADIRAAYQSRLLAGHGYDDEHRRLLAALQDEQLRHRNRIGGYWIAEADPAAAGHALTHRARSGETPWCVLATDGAYKPMELHEWDDWQSVAELDGAALVALLRRCHDWEATDPAGQVLPRAKPHDDKTLASVQLE